MYTIASQKYCAPICTDMLVLTLKILLLTPFSMTALYASISPSVSSVSKYLLLSKNDVGANFTVDWSAKRKPVV